MINFKSLYAISPMLLILTQEGHSSSMHGKHSFRIVFGLSRPAAHILRNPYTAPMHTNSD